MRSQSDATDKDFFANTMPSNALVAFIVLERFDAFLCNNRNHRKRRRRVCPPPANNCV